MRSLHWKMQNKGVWGTSPTSILQRKQYEKAITVTDAYHETKTRFAWVGEVQNERLHTGLEKLSDEDLKLLTLYAVSGFNEHEIAKVFGLSQPDIHKRIAKITLFLKKF